VAAAPKEKPLPLSFAEPDAGEPAIEHVAAPTTERVNDTLPAPEPPPARRVKESISDDEAPAAVVPVVAKEGGGLGGWIMLGTGAVLALAGGSAAVWGSLPYFDYASLCGSALGATDCPALDAIGDDYRRADDEDDRAKLADDAADLRGRVDNAAQAWDEGNNGGVIPTGRFVLGGGAGVGLLGIGLAVAGLMGALSSDGDAAQQESE
jgi:hypothetical protein